MHTSPLRCGREPSAATPGSNTPPDGYQRGRAAVTARSEATKQYKPWTARRLLRFRLAATGNLGLKAPQEPLSSRQERHGRSRGAPMTCFSTSVLRRTGLALACVAIATPALAQQEVKIGIGFGVAFLPTYLMDEMKLVEKHAKFGSSMHGGAPTT
jgi:hypothetical protein